MRLESYWGFDAMVNDEFVTEMDKDDTGNFRKIERYLYKICLADGIFWGAVYNLLFCVWILDDVRIVFYGELLPIEIECQWEFQLQSVTSV